MAPKKKGGKKQDDWEADLGEVPDPIASATQEAKADEAQQDAAANGNVDDDSMGGGGLLAALRKNKTKRAKKGKLTEDFVEGEDPTGTSTPVGEAAINGKAPEEATFDDDDVFAGTGKKGKGSKKEPAKVSQADEDEDKDDNMGLKSKKEKEKEKKEREKQRKKEQV
jgi:translation initiation factor 5B